MISIFSYNIDDIVVDNEGEIFEVEAIDRNGLWPTPYLKRMPRLPEWCRLATPDEIQKFKMESADEH